MAGAPIANGSQNDDAMISAINVTPFVDVALVLLVIFMITAPILAKDILKIKLPKTATSDGRTLSQIGISINRDGLILLNGQPMNDDSLRAEVQRAIKSDPDTQAIISGDTATPYGNVVKAIDLVKAAGLTKFALQIEHR